MTLSSPMLFLERGSSPLRQCLVVSRCTMGKGVQPRAGDPGTWVSAPLSDLGLFQYGQFWCRSWHGALGVEI